MTHTKRLSFSPVFLVNIFLLLTLVACTIPGDVIDDIGEGLASLELFVATSGNDANDCQTAETACQTVWRAVQLANDMTGASIRIAPGTYNETNDLMIQKGMTLQGETGVVINRLYNFPGIPSTVVINLTAGQLVNINNVEIQSSHYGVWVTSGRANFDQVIFSNIATHALHIGPDHEQATIIIENSRFTNIQGYPILARDRNVEITLRNVSIDNNDQTAIINYGSTLTLDGVVIWNNQSDGYYPSAILNGLDSDIGTGEGGILHISNSAIYNNTNRSDPAASVAIRHGGEFLEISNTTISGNSGSGISLGRSNETLLTHVTIANHANTGILGQLSLTYRLTLRNSLVVYNGRDCDFTTIYTTGFPEFRTRIVDSIDSDNTCRDPLAAERAAWDYYPGVDGALRDNGGSSPTHALLPDSPAVDAVLCILGLTGDQRGVARPQGLRCDIGAFELEAELVAPPPAATWTPVSILQQTTPNATFPLLPSPTTLPTAVPSATPLPQPPATPVQFAIESRICTGQAYSVTLRWQDAANNEQGYHLYRDGVLLATLDADTTKYTDNPAYGGPYTYGVEAFNTVGASSRPTVVEVGCIP